MTSNENAAHAALGASDRNETPPEANRTLCLIKPDAVRRGKVGEVLAMLEPWFNIVRADFVRPTRKQAMEHYMHHDGRPYFNDLVTFTTSGPLMPLILVSRFSDKPAPANLRSIMGPYKDAPRGTVRGELMQEGRPAYENLIHGADGYQDAEREAAIWFDLRRGSIYTA